MLLNIVMLNGFKPTEIQPKIDLIYLFNWFNRFENILSVNFQI